MPPKTAVAPVAPPAEPEDKYVTIELPDGMTAESLLEASAEELVEADEPEPVVPAKPAPAAKRPVVAPEPVAEPAPVRRPLTDVSRRAVVPLPKLLQERDKVTALSGDNARLKIENSRLRAVAIQARMVEQARIDPVTITDQDRYVLAKIAADISATESDLGKVQGQVQIKTAEFLAAKFNAVRVGEATRRTADSEQHRLDVSQNAIRQEHEAPGAVAPGWDYDSVCTASGIFRAFMLDPETQTYAEPATVADIKASADPARRAYELGLARLDERGWVPAEAEAAEPEVEAEPEPVKPAKLGGKKEPPAPTTPAAARRASAAEVEAAERRGERRGAAVVVNRAEERGRGIRHLPSAGGGPARTQVTAEFLDALKDRDPDKWLDVLKNNPKLEYDYMSGSLT